MVVGGSLGPQIVKPLPVLVLKVLRRVWVLQLPLGLLLAATVVCPFFLPLHREERFLITEISRELLAPLLHEALVALGDEETALRVEVTTAVLVGDEAQSGCEELGLREGLNIGVVQVAP
jgi:hypothetical protein